MDNSTDRDGLLDLFSVFPWIQFINNSQPSDSDDEITEVIKMGKETYILNFSYTKNIKSPKCFLNHVQQIKLINIMRIRNILEL